MIPFARHIVALPEAEGPYTVSGDVYHQDALRRIGEGRHEATLDTVPDERTGNGDEVVVRIRGHRIGWVRVVTPEEQALFRLVHEHREGGAEVCCRTRITATTESTPAAARSAERPHYRAVLLVPELTDHPAQEQLP